MLSGRKIRKWLSFLAVAAALWTVGTFVMPQEAVTYSIEDGKIHVFHSTSIGFRAEVNNSFSIVLADIDSCRLVQVDRSIPLLEGTDTRQCRYGTMKPTEQEILHVCLYNQPDYAVRIQTRDGNGYLVSFIDDDNTKGFYEGLRKLLEQQ